MAKTWCD